MHLRPRPPGRRDSWCWPGSNSCAHFIIKRWLASSVSPAIDVSYIRHKIMLTLPLPTPTLLVEQGFAGVLTALRCIRFGSAATHRSHSAPCCSHAVQGFDSPPFVGPTLAETR